MKKIEALWEKLKNKGLVSNTKVNPLSLEERMQEKVNKLSKIKRSESREIIHSLVIPIEKSQVTQATVKNEAKEDWKTYEEKKRVKIEKEGITSFREELDKRFGKSYNSQKLMIIFKESEVTSNLIAFSGILLAELLHPKILELVNSVKESIGKIIKKVQEKLLIYIIALEENRVLLN